ncbi:amino acid--[acyl-carrier-protein] ligase [Jannaschia pagri]|uniref:Amino acid--[acyl-carrier-protein] ligase n=2 Tax=Roseobacteraceae TaxID=2854170 RepID=A0ABQ4NMA4_9RHOB|nr:amino acid--[acyl-carrier-protein] ligase [Jannaschia sp. AI_61]GIT95540.1 amino acid--[acyl-carrier-protein] ligase [Jannaschia sp. AI_62]
MESYPGNYGLSGDFLSVVEALDNAISEMASKLGAVPQSFPVLLPISSLIENASIRNFPQQALLTSRITSRWHSEISDWPRLISEEESIRRLDDMVEASGAALSPTICYHCFEALKNTELDHESATFTALGMCHRHESDHGGSLDRLNSFRMREIVFFGDNDMVENSRVKVILDCIEMFRRLDLSFELKTADDPFFKEKIEIDPEMAFIDNLKHELRVKLPYLGQDVACMSFNNHQHMLTSIYAIRRKSGGKVSSGCVGIGYERTAFALFSQHGLHLKEWPTKVKTSLNL